MCKKIFKTLMSINIYRFQKSSLLVKVKTNNQHLLLFWGQTCGK